MQFDQKQEVRVHIRWMIRRDMPEVPGHRRREFRVPLARRRFHPLPAAAQLHRDGRRARRPGRGFMIYELHRTRIHVLKLCRGRSPSSLRHRQPDDRQLAAKLSSQRRSRIVLEVRETNLAAQVFFRETGSAPSPCCAAIMPTRRKTPT